MRTLIVSLMLGFPCFLGAQQVVMPASSATDHVYTQSAGLNAGAAYWGSSTGMEEYAVTGDGTTDVIKPGVADQHLGLTWTTSAPTSLESTLARMNATGGTVRVIFVGESAGWLDSFGYTRSGNPTAGNQSYTAWKEIQTIGSNANISFGNYFDVTLAAGAMNSFDLWYSAAGVFGGSPTTKTSLGGVYTLFHNASAQSLWASSSIAVNTVTATAPSGASVDTYLVSYEDWRLNAGSDADYSDLRIALQFFNPDGSAYDVSVPEPAAWATIVGLVTLLFVIARRMSDPARSSLASGRRDEPRSS